MIAFAEMTTFYLTKMSDNTKPRQTRERTDNVHADKKRILLVNILIKLLYTVSRYVQRDKNTTSQTIVAPVR